MKDIEYVRELLAKDYLTEYPHEIPHPPLDQVIRSEIFDYLAGTIEGEVPNGETSREGNPYLWFKHTDKSILSHRFISAVTLGMWVPRDCNIDHINHNPSDNRPSNLRITTPRDNAGNRRQALLSELVDIEKVGVKMEEIKSLHGLGIEPEPDPFPETITVTDESIDELTTQRPKHVGAPMYTGDTKPGFHSGVYFGTTIGSWHWYPDGAAPAQEDFCEDR